MRTHSLTHTLSLHKMERLSGIKIHIDRVESHKHPSSLRMSNIPLGADHSVLLPCFKIQLHKRFRSFGGIKHTHTFLHTFSGGIITDKVKYRLKDRSLIFVTI